MLTGIGIGNAQEPAKEAAQEPAKTAKAWTLSDCIEYALKNNIQLQKTRISRLSAEQDVLQSEAALLPTLNANTSQNLTYRPWVASGMSTVSNGYVQSSVDKVYYSGNYGLNMNWTVWNGNQNRNAILQNKLARQQAELDSAITANNIQEQIAQLYVQILYSNEAIRVSKESLATSMKNEERGSEMVKVGKMSKADLAQLTAQRAQDEYNVVAAESNELNYKRQLKQLLQITDNVDFEVAVPETTDAQALAEIPSMQSVYEAALENRPEIQNTKLNIQNSELSMKIAKAGKLPTVGVSASASTNTTTMSSTSWGEQSKNNFNMGAGVTLSIPLIDGRKTKTAISKATLQRESALLDLRDQQTTLYSNIENYWLQALNNQNKYKAARISVQSEQASYHLLSEQFRLGLKNIIELMTGKDKLLSAQQNELQSKYLTILNLQMLKFYQGEKLSL
ncbi:MAG: TolC family protein [Prevotella sp.]|nr:TolC family protein [Prevotella sp.]